MYKQHVARFREFHRAETVDRAMFANVRMGQEDWLGEKRLLFTAEVLEMLLKTDERTLRWVDVPRDWWQAARERWAPKWWLRRHPVKRTRYPVIEQRNMFNVCPHVAKDPQADHLQFLSYDALPHFEPDVDWAPGVPE